ncbi:glycosyltransferase family 4 protein [Citreicoccus inhibens]|uniref:glycosyltransferase family 4 protein n=1 Tax=Citreicoccus inhibens TaxID=2849499 RepID=UPI001F1CF0E4|nr:glycosyltransferase family 4 protein [Citreicoccus inhibens]
MRPYTLIAGDFVDTGGMDRANLALADWLVRQGGKVRLVAHRISDSLRQHPRVHFVKVPRPAGAALLGEPLLDAAGRFWATRTLAEGGEVVANGGNCAVPAVNWVHYVHGAWKPEATGTPLRQLKTQLSHALYVQRERVALRRARLIIANSARTREDLLAATGVPEDRVHVVYLGSDPERFRPPSWEERRAARAALGWPEARRVALFIGALGDRRKGFDRLFSAWARLCTREGWDVELKVVGEGAQRSAWERQALAQGMGSRLQFLGFRKDVHVLLSAADVLVAPTRYEPYGLGVHEALCAGIPALVSRSAGVAECYPPELRRLLLDASDDVGALVQALEAWRSEADMLAPRVAALSEVLRARSWDAMAASFVKRLEE